MREITPEKQIELISVERTSLIVPEQLEIQRRKHKQMTRKDWIIFAVLVCGVFIGMFAYYVLFGY